MAEPTLALKLTDIQAKLGRFAGWGAGSDFGDTPWTSAQQRDIDDATQSGLRRFYYPHVMRPDGTELQYEWSFLKPTASLDLPSGEHIIPLPDDFGSFDGKLTVLAVGSVSSPWQIEWRNEASIRSMYSIVPTMTAPPMFAAEMPLKGTTGTQGQRKQLILYPLSDAHYTLQGTYNLNPDYLSGAFPYAYGGPQHIETILESCLAVMEERLDDTSGVHAAAFEKRLLASISMDRRNKAQHLGPNLDRSDEIGGMNRQVLHYLQPAMTYNGNPFS